MEHKAQIFLEQLKTDLIQNYDATGRRASGNYAESLEYFINYSLNHLNIKMVGAKQAMFMENGRQPNQNQDEESIRRFVNWAGSTFLKKWVQDKGLSISPYAVAYKIARQGYKGNQVVSSVITEKRINDFVNSLGELIQQNIKSEVIKAWQ